MDESDQFGHLSENEKIKALQLVVSADGYLSQSQLLKALNLYKESAMILPDPAIIRKIKKLRKYMKRNGMDLGEDKENESIEKKVSPGISPTPNSGQTLRERINFGSSRDNPTKDAKIIPDKVLDIKSESPVVWKQERREDKVLEIKSESPVIWKKERQEDVPESKNLEKASARSPTDETQHIQHTKLRLSTSELSPKKVPHKQSNRDVSVRKISPPAKSETPNRDEPIRSFKDLRKRMYPHQREGMKWLARLFGEQKGGILGDDMGLGKTLQVIGYLSKMFEVNEVEHVLIVLPNALVLPWQSEMSRWAPNLNFAVFHGKTLKNRVKLLHNLQREGGILLTTYGLIVTNYEELSKGPDGREFLWDYVFLDEGHKIKNPTKTQKAAHYIPAQNRIIVTGTPIQNNLMEMWSLFDFVHHGSLLGNQKTFRINYESPIIRARQKDASLAEKQLGYRMSLNLQKIIAPYFLRRTKAELMADPNSGLPQLPRKNDIIVWVKMTEDQKKVYESYLKLDEVKGLMHSSRSPLVALNILKKLCDHLRLLSVRICKALGMLTREETIKNARDGISHLDDPNEVPEWTRQVGTEDSTVSSSKPTKDTDCAATQLTGIPDSLLYKESSKLMVAIELLGYLSATGHKCLVFSQSTKMLDIIQQILNNLRYRYVRMDGTITKLEERAEIIRRFETNKDIHIFLLTTQVGGVGLNLTVADRIIIMDPSWNPAIDSQAVDRVYRIGQKKNVIIFRLITCGSVEEKIYIRQLFKLSINKQTTKESKDPFRYFTKQDLKQLFIVEDLDTSETQLQLTQMHSHKRVSDEVVDDQIKFLESMDNVFGVSDHDLVFSTEDGDHEAKMSNERLETMVVRAEEAIRGEINQESCANSKKIVPGIQERRPPSIETMANEPAKFLSSPLFSIYGEEESKDEVSSEVRHQRSNADRISPPLSPSSDAIVLSDEEAPATSPHRKTNKNNEDAKDDDIIILSDAHSDANDDNNDDSSEVIMDSEDDERPPPPRGGRSTLSAFSKHREIKAEEDGEPLPTKTSSNSREFNTPSNRNPTKAPNSRRQSLANMTLARAIADSPLSPAKGGLKNVLVADSPDILTKSTSTSSQHSSDNVSPGNGTKFTVAESDYESDDESIKDDVVMESQDEEEAEDRSSKNVNSSGVGEDDSREFRSPAFRDLSVVVPNSSPRAGFTQTKDQTASPVSAGQCPESEETDEAPVASGMQSLTERLHTTLTMEDDDDIVVRRNTKRATVLSSSESEAELEKPHSFSGSPVGAGNSGEKGNISSENEDDDDGDDDNFGKVRSSGKSVGSCSLALRKSRKHQRAILSDSSSSEEEEEDDDQAASLSFSHPHKLNGRPQRRESGKRISSSEEEYQAASSSFVRSDKLSERPQKPKPMKINSSSEEEYQPASSSFSHSDKHAERPQKKRDSGKRKRFVLLSDDDDEDNENEAGNGNAADNSLIVTEELNVSINPLEPLLKCIKTPPAKVARSRLRDLERSLMSPPQSDSRSPSSNKSLAKRLAGPALKSGVDTSEDEEDGDSSMARDVEDEEESGDSVEEEEKEDSENEEEEEDSEDEEEEEDSEDEEEEEDSEDDEEEDSDNIDLPAPSSKKSDSYNKYINASREAYDAEDYVEALRHALQALKQDSSDLTLQMYALWLRKMTKK